MKTLPRNSRIFVAGHAGLVGRAVLRRLEAEGFTNVLTATRAQLDLRDQAAVNYWFKANRPEYLYLVAGTVGGIMANSTRPAEFIYDNMMIHATVVHAAYTYDVRKLLYLGSSCIYPRNATQPITEDQLLTGELEGTNEAYAIAKIAGIKLCQSYRQQYGCDFISAMPTNLYGPNDNFDLTSSHVLPALIRKFYDAKNDGREEVEIWGTGSAMREFLHVDDLASACLHLMDHYSEAQHINVGTGVDLTIKALAESIRDLVYPKARLVFDTTKPDGTPRKVLNVDKLAATGWKPSISLEEGLRSTYEWFLREKAEDAHMRGIEAKPHALQRGYPRRPVCVAPKSFGHDVANIQRTSGHFGGYLRGELLPGTDRHRTVHGRVGRTPGGPRHDRAGHHHVRPLPALGGRRRRPTQDSPARGPARRVCHAAVEPYAEANDGSTAPHLRDVLQRSGARPRARRCPGRRRYHSRSGVGVGGHASRASASA